MRTTNMKKLALALILVSAIVYVAILLRYKKNRLAIVHTIKSVAGKFRPSQAVDTPEREPQQEAVEPKTTQQQEVVKPKTAQQQEAVKLKTSQQQEAVEPKTVQQQEAVKRKTSQQQEGVKPKTAQQQEVVKPKTAQPDCTVIPKILHQAWKNENVPHYFHEAVQSWIKLHPEWEYWFWTDKDANHFMQKRFPKYYKMYSGYKCPIQKSNVLRYFVLYDIGGVFADLDTVALRNFNAIRQRKRCFLTPETPGRMPGINKPLSNSLMGAGCRHPFFKMLIGNLQVNRNKTSVTESTGAGLLTNIWKRYQEKERNGKPMDAYVLDVKSFCLPPGGWNTWHVQKMCSAPALTPLQRSVCYRIKRSKFYRKTEDTVYAFHKWSPSRVAEGADRFGQQNNTEKIIYAVQVAKDMAKAIDRLSAKDIAKI